MKKRLIIGNWKMYIESPDAAKKYVATLRRKVAKMQGVEAWLAPSFTLLPAAVAAAKGSTLKVGGQALSAKSGPHTGEVSARMLKQAGAQFVLVGHSERRAAGDSNADVRAQLLAAAAEGLVPVLCVGELQRDAQGAHFTYIEEQLSSALREGPIAKLVIAYEPVWVIGQSGEHALPLREVEEMVIFIRKTLAQMLGRETAHKTSILYGAAVEPENAAKLIADSGAAGLLVGHASADVDSFIEILRACQK